MSDATRSPRSLEDWRSEFPILETSTYLISNSLGAMPRKTKDSLAEYARIWEEMGVQAWAEGWWVKQNELADLLGPILGVQPDAISMHQNVAVASQVFSSAIDFSGSRNKIVYTDMNFPSLMYLYNGLAAQRGAEIQVVESEDGIGVPTEKLLAAIDDRTALVPISHVLFRSAFIQDAQAIIARAHEVGAIVLLDCFQSVGTVPLELEKWGCHAATGGALKFLCGGPGACFLYVDPDLGKNLTPAFTGWMAHKQPFDFDTGPQDLRDDGWRFLHGTPNVPGLYAAIEGVRIIHDVGLDRIREHSMRQTALLVQEAQAMGFEVKAPLDPAVRGGTVAVDVPDGYEVCQELLDRRFIVDYRPGAGIRIAPHFYTRDEECRAALTEIQTILETGAHERHKNQPHKPG